MEVGQEGDRAEAVNCFGAAVGEEVGFEMSVGVLEVDSGAGCEVLGFGSVDGWMGRVGEARVYFTRYITNLVKRREFLQHLMAISRGLRNGRSPSNICTHAQGTQDSSDDTQNFRLLLSLSSSSSGSSTGIKLPQDDTFSQQKQQEACSDLARQKRMRQCASSQDFYPKQIRFAAVAA